MPGFQGFRLVGKSAAAAILRYHWPVWHMMDGAIQVSTGNVFGDRFSGFKGDNLRLSFATGFAAIRTRDHIFHLLVGFGTQTFGEGASIDQVRVSFGTNSGFQ
jgi:hypothetical protein